MRGKRAGGDLLFSFGQWLPYRQVPHRGRSEKKYTRRRCTQIHERTRYEYAKEHMVQPASIALAWLIARPSITAPIASATTTEQLNDLMKATEIKLNTAQISKLNDASAY